MDIKESMSMNWTDIMIMEKRGELINFNISLKRIRHSWEFTNATKFSFYLAKGDVFSMHIANLQNYTEYEIQIAGITTVGQGPMSNVFVIRTAENGKKTTQNEYNVFYSNIRLVMYIFIIHRSVKTCFCFHFHTMQKI